MIDASKGFMKDGPKNRLRSQDIHKIVDIFNKQTEIARYSRMVPFAEIDDPKNDHNLNIPRYIDSSMPEDIQDLHAHLQGGIPERDIDALAPYWDAFPSLRSALFKPNRPGYVDLAIDITRVQQTILSSEEFKSFAKAVQKEIDGWFTNHRPTLESLSAETMPNALITTLGDDLLERFKAAPLLDAYDVYEQLMTYWHSTMHDDIFLLMSEGWVEAIKPRAARIIGYDKDKKPKFEECHIQFGIGVKAQRYVMDLLPPTVVTTCYFPDGQAKSEQLHAVLEEASQGFQEYVEEHNTEDGPLWELIDEKGKITRKYFSTALRKAQADGDDDAVEVLTTVILLSKQEEAAKKAAKDAQSALDLATLRKYGELNVADIQQLVLKDKWYASIAAGVGSEVNALTLALVARIQELGERYAETVDELNEQLRSLDIKVAAHLADMGVN
jgi:type I restriction enzyme M protein